MSAISDVLWTCSKHGDELPDDMRCLACEEEMKMTNEQDETGRILGDPHEMWDSRYQEYTLLCTNGDVTPMPYDVWLAYQEHVERRPNPLSEETFRRMQEPESVKPFDRTTAGSPSHEEAQHEMNSLRSEVQLLTEENESLIADLSDKTDQVCSLNSELDVSRSGYRYLKDSSFPVKQQLIDNYESQKADLWKKIDELRGANQLLRAENEELNQENEELSLKLHALQTNPSTTTGQLRQDSDDINYQNTCLLEENERLNKENEELSSDLDKLHEGTPLAVETRTTPANQPLYPHYFREVPRNTTHVDISWVLRAWDVPCCEGHAIKKLMASGKRGGKDKLQDLKEARDSISRAIELENTK